MYARFELIFLTDLEIFYLHTMASAENPDVIAKFAAFMSYIFWNLPRKTNQMSPPTKLGNF